MPSGPAKTSKPTLAKIVTYALVAVAAFLVLRFVFSVAMSILKFVALGALVVFVLWLFLSKGGTSDSD